MAWGEQSRTQEPDVRRDRAPESKAEAQSPSQSFLVSPPSISLPKGGGAIRSIGEKFSANPVTGTGSMTVPIAVSPGRAGFGPQLALTYDSGVGNGIFGLGWNLSLPSVTRKTDKGLPRYLDADESDVFILAGMEDLVPVLDAAGNRLTPEPYTVYGTKYLVRRYLPRVEGSFALIERWVQDGKPANSFWRTISRDNITTLYGRTADSRIADPADASRIFQWLICESYDDKGNAIVYKYEDDRRVATNGTAERNRLADHRTVNRYPKSILYGNLKPYFPTLTIGGNRWEAPDSVSGQAWMFEVVFDYGDHQQLIPTPVPDTPWEIRADPFSSHRSGFEIRTYRLCKRILMFHHFPGIARVGSNCLVRSTDFDYRKPNALSDPEQAGYTVLRSVTHRAFQRKPRFADGYEDPREFPPVTFTYSEPKVNRIVQRLAPEELENLPVGTQGPGYQWVDLDGEGLSGVLTEQASAWYYKPNLGDGKFGPLRVVAQKPAMAALASGRQQLMDLAGDGEIDLVDFGGPTPGFHERERDESWKHFTPFASLPNIEWGDPNLRFVDLTGDGHADVLISEDEVFTWYPSLDERGFAAAKRTRQAHDDDLGPRVIFADGTETIFLADMCGDGLTDLVRIRNGEICYWPNIGYGHFDRKVTFENSPRFEHTDLYYPQRIRLADIDGSGPADVIYLGRDGAELYFNRSGNSLSDKLVVDLPVATENLGAVQVADLLGNGTACLVWNSHLPADARQPVRYIDLMGGEQSLATRTAKPHLLVQLDNNLGSKTEIEYTPSTRFYIQDKLAGTPWITRLPFPVHCVSKVTVRDKWRGTAFSSTYSYHHGYFDGPEREFRGFGRVEQTDVEDYGKFLQGNVASPFITSDKNLYQPPIRTITWYHTGAALDRQRILTQFASEYFPARFKLQGKFKERALPEPELPDDLTGDEWREALRACKGMVLRQEVYELDIDDLAASPRRDTPVRLYSAATHNCRIERLQARGENQHSVFFVTESEALNYQYELALPKGGGAVEADPRVTHTFNLRHDRYGNPQQAIAVAYARYGTQAPALLPGTHPRAGLIAAVQSEMHVAYTETRYTNDVVTRAARPGAQQGPVRHRRLRLPCEVRTYEIMRLRKPASGYFDIAELRRHELCEDELYPPVVTAPAQAVPLSPLEYHQQPPPAMTSPPPQPPPYRRLVEHVRTLFFKDEDSITRPSEPHPMGTHGPRGLKYEDYKLALTDNLLDAIFKLRDPVTRNVIEDKLASTLDATGPAVRGLLDDPAISGYVRGSPVDANSSGRYWIRSGVAGFAADAARHFYLPEEYRDPFGNLTTLSYDARDLFAESITDARGNRATVRQFDYRVLSPREMEDANGNRTEVAFDILGRVVASATKGKRKGGAWQGDQLKDFTDALTNPSEIAVQSFCTAPAVNETTARNWLDKASSRSVYHFGERRDAVTNRVIAWADRMAGVCTITRERHAGQLRPGEQSPLQVALECSDGAGNVLMTKIQAEPANTNGPPRWLINGLTVLNNKGKPVKQYEPAFSDRFGCQLPSANGVTSVMFYDAAGRLVRTEFPDGTLGRIEFSPWHVKTYDQNDTVLGSTWHAQRSTAATPTEEQTADRLAVKHANTPALTILDSLGREVISIAHNREPDDSSTHSSTPLLDRPWRDNFAVTYTKLDAEGKPLWIRDALGKLVMQYITPPKSNVDPSDVIPAGTSPCYDIAGNRLFQHSMDAGDRWMLTDAAGKPMVAWDFNERTTDTGNVVSERRLFHTRYDALHRPVEQWLRINSDRRALIEVFEYVDADTFRNSGGVLDQGALDTARDNNLVGQAVKHYDPSGLATLERVDFKGSVEEVTRRLIKDVDAPVIDWDITNRAQRLETEVFRHITQYDALGRPATVFNWHLDSPAAGGLQRISVYVPSYNERGLLKSEKLHVRAGTQTQNGRLMPATQNGTRTVDAIKHISWNEKGQKTRLQLGNGTTTSYTYAPETFRLIRLQTPRVQDLRYTYDPVGNITYIRDDAQDTIFFNNQQIDPDHDYVYDALYRLIEATGRENAGAVAPPPHPEGRWPTGSFPSPNATHRYRQRYAYDEVGNFLQMRHSAPEFPGGQSSSGWTRSYRLAADSNQLAETVYGTNPRRVTYRYDQHGNMLNLENTAPGLDIRWDWRDMIRALDLQGGGDAYYNYGIDKQRTRKFIKRNGSGTEDRIYLGGYELYRRRNPQGDVIEEIESLHLFDGEQRVLLVDDVLRARRNAQPGPNGLSVKEQTLFRYQYGNNLGSASAELDEATRVISYEEFHPYGTTAYRLIGSAKEVPAKRYRYTGMERDEESGLDYHTARYFAPQIARWTRTDAILDLSATTRYAYVHSRPIGFLDPSGDYDWQNFKSDVWAGIKGIPGAIVEPLLVVQDLQNMAATLWMATAFGIDEKKYRELTKKDISTAIPTNQSATTQRIEAGQSGWRAGLVLATAIPTAGATPMLDSWVTVFEKDMTPDQAASFLVQGTTQQVVLTAGAKGAQFVKSIGEAPAQGVAEGIAEYAKEVERQHAKPEPVLAPLPEATWPRIGGVPVPPTGKGSVLTGKSATAIPDPAVIGKKGFTTSGTNVDLESHKVGTTSDSALQGATDVLLTPDKQAGAARFAVDVGSNKGWVFKVFTQFWDANSLLYAKGQQSSPFLSPEAAFAGEAELTIRGNIPGTSIEGWWPVELVDGNIQIGEFVPNPNFRR